MAVIDLRDPRGGTGQQIADMGQQMLQFFMQREQLKLAQEAQKLKKSEFDFEVEKNAAQQQAALPALQMLANANPQVMQALLQANPTMGAAPGVGDATNPNAFLPEGQGDVRMLPHYASPASMLQNLQATGLGIAQEANIKADTKGKESATKKTDAETSEILTLMPARQALLEANAALEAARTNYTNVQAQEDPKRTLIAQREVAVAERNASTAERQQKAAEAIAATEAAQRRLDAAANLGATLGDPTAGRRFYGLPAGNAAFSVLRDAEMQIIDASREVSADPAEQQAWADEQRRSLFAEGLNIAGPQQLHADGFWEQAEGSAQEALNLVAESQELQQLRMAGGEEAYAQAMAKLVAYYNLLDPSQPLEIPGAPKGSRLHGLIRAFMQSGPMTGAPEAVTSRLYRGVSSNNTQPPR